jgi:hypothetical protein
VKVLWVFIWAELMPVIPPVMLLELMLEVSVFQKELEIDPVFPPANGFAVQLLQTTVPVEYEFDTLLTDQLLPMNPQPPVTRRDTILWIYSHHCLSLCRKKDLKKSQPGKKITYTNTLRNNDDRYHPTDVSLRTWPEPQIS